jgi:hypothetical protein
MADNAKGKSKSRIRLDLNGTTSLTSFFFSCLVKVDHSRFVSGDTNKDTGRLRRLDTIRSTRAETRSHTVIGKSLHRGNEWWGLLDDQGCRLERFGFIRRGLSHTLLLQG